MKTLVASELATPLAALLLDAETAAALLDRIAEAGATTVTALVSGETEERRVPTLMTLGWLAKMGFIRTEAGPDAIPDGGDDDTLPFGKSLSWKRLAGS